MLVSLGALEFAVAVRTGLGCGRLELEITVNGTLVEVPAVVRSVSGQPLRTTWAHAAECKPISAQSLACEQLGSRSVRWALHDTDVLTAPPARVSRSYPASQSKN